MKNRILQSRSKIFLIDAIGALTTTIILGIVFTNFQESIGMPIEILISLALIALAFCIYSFSCFFTLNSNWRPFLKAIAIANLLYCILTTALMIIFFNMLTLLGIVYFIGEIIVIGVLVYVEFSVFNRIENT